MSEVQSVEMKLVGPNTFSSPKVENRRIINKGEVVAVDPSTADYLEKLTYRDASNNDWPMFIRKGEKHRAVAVKKAQDELDADSQGDGGADDGDEDSAAPAPQRRRSRK